MYFWGMLEESCGYFILTFNIIGSLVAACFETLYFFHATF